MTVGIPVEGVAGLTLESRSNNQRTSGGKKGSASGWHAGNAMPVRSPQSHV